MTDTLDPLQLSPIQHMYWLGQQLRPESPFLNVALVFKLRGDIDSARFSQAFDAVVAGADALRMVVETKKGRPKLRIQYLGPGQMRHLDLIEDPDPGRRARAIFEKSARKPIDPAQAAFDSMLVRISPEQVLWYLAVHHVFTDFPGMLAICRRQLDHYERIAADQAAPQETYPQFSAYLSHKVAEARSPRRPQGLKYWQSLPAPWPFRVAGQVPRKRSTRVRRVSREIEPDLAAEVYRKGAAAPFFAVSAELGVYNLLLSAYLLHLQDIFGGTPGLITTVHNRFSESLRETIGLVMEMAPVVIPGAAQDSLAAVAGRVKRASRQTFTWYAQGGVEALQELDLDVVFNLHAYPVLEFNGQTVDYWRVWPGHGSESLALGVNLTPETNRIQLHHDFHEDVFSPSEMDAISDRLVETLARALADPEAGLDRLRLGPNPLEERLPPVSEPVAEPSRQAPPRDYLEAELVKIWESVIKRSPIGIRDDFFDLGGSSWLATQLFATIQDTLGHNLPLSALLQATTIAQLAALIRSQRMSSPRSQLVPLKKGRSQPALFLVPGVGGNVLSLARLADGMAADENIFAFETQSIDGIRAGRPIREVAAHLIKVMRTHQPDGPYLIGGYSWGGMVAYEMATQLRTAGQSLAFVAILDTPAQGKWYGRLQAWIQRWGQSRGWDQPRTIDGFLKIRDPLFRFEYYLQTLFRKPGRLREEFKRQRWLDRQEGVRQRSGRRRIRAEGFWSQFDLEPVRHEMVMANDRYLRLHVPEPIDYPILLFRTVKGYLNPLVRSPYWDLGWKRLAQNGLELIPVPGNHIQMLKQPHVQEVSRLLQLQLDSARAMLDNE